MRQHFAEGFVDLGGSGLASQAVAKLGFDHREGRFDVRPFVIGRHEVRLIERIPVKHSFPNLRMPRLSRYAIRLERDKRHRVIVHDCLQIVTRQIGFVGAHLTHGEVASGSLNESGELRTVVGVRVGNFNAGDDVGFDAAHQMHLDPLVALHQFRIGVFGFCPLNEAASSESPIIGNQVQK